MEQIVTDNKDDSIEEFDHFEDEEKHLGNLTDSSLDETESKIESSEIEPEPEKKAEHASVESETDEDKKKKPFWQDPLQTIVLAVLIFLLLNTLTSRVKVFNVSMQPTLKQGYLLVVNKMAYKLGQPKRGDVIVFHHKGNENQDYIKRVIGLPGDTVEISGGVVTVNGTILTEPYIMEQPRYTLSEMVPEGKLFVLGDNRNQSDDSHSWGFVDMEWVVGKAFMIYWPLDALKILTVSDEIKNISPGVGTENQDQGLLVPAFNLG